jgi:hypothetical protein
MDMNMPHVSKIQVIGGTILSVVIATIVAPLTYANSTVNGVNAAQGEGQPADLFGVGGTITAVVNILLYVVGLLSVIMIIVGGIRYVISGGNSAAVSAAKNTVLYAIVGLVVAFLAYAIINFVLDALTGGMGDGTDV